MAEETTNPVLAGREPGKTYNTELDPLREFAFRQWVQDRGVPFDAEATTPQDYDMRGFWQAMQQGDPRATSAIDPNDNKIHYPDYWKTPLHKTFSNESQWAPTSAPRWTGDDKLVTPGGRVVFDDKAKKSSGKYDSRLLSEWDKKASGKQHQTAFDLRQQRLARQGLPPDFGDQTTDVPTIMIPGMVKDLATLGPIRRFMDAVQVDTQHMEPGYQPTAAGPGFETALMLTGLGGAKAEAGTTVLGALGGSPKPTVATKLDPEFQIKKTFLDDAVPVDIWATDASKLMPGQKVMAGPGGPTGTFKGISPGGTTLVDWKDPFAPVPEAAPKEPFISDEDFKNAMDDYFSFKTDKKPTGGFDKLDDLDTIFGKKAADKPLKVSEMDSVGGQLGSNKGGIFADKSGNKYYVKQPPTPDHVANELAAARLYELAGVKTLKYKDVEGGGHVDTHWENLDKKNINELTPAERKEATKDFATHAWLSNWDAAGLYGDNIGVIGGKPVVLDVGGSLKYRAMGQPKGGLFGNNVTEIDTLRDPKINPNSAGLFGKMTDQEIRESVERVVKIPDDKIREAAGDDQLANILVTRKQDLAKRFGISDKKPSFAYSVGEAKGKFQQAEEESWAMLKKGFEQAKGVKSPSLLDQIPGLKEKMPDRARMAGGYTEPAYRGIKIYPGNKLRSEHGASLMYSTADPMLADMYSDYLSHHPGQVVPEGAFSEGATVAPLWINPKDYHYADAKGEHWSKFNAFAITDAKKAGKKGVVIDNVWDEPNSTHNLEGPKKIFITFPEGASTVKSKFASKFDPSSPDMLQGIGVIGIGGPAGYVSMTAPGSKMNQPTQSSGSAGQKPQTPGQKPTQPQSGGQGNPQMSPGVMKFIMEFLKANPDLAKEMSTRMQAVINGKQIQGQQQGAPGKPPQAMPQQPPQGMPQTGMPMP